MMPLLSSPARLHNLPSQGRKGRSGNRDIIALGKERNGEVGNETKEWYGREMKVNEERNKGRK